MHAFCDDFDTPGFRYGWDLGMPDGGSLQSAAATSPPNAFSSKTPALDAGESALADLHARVLPRNGATSYSFDVRIGSLTFPAPAAASGVTLARIERLDINFNTHEVLDLVARPAANGFRLVLQEGAIDGGGGFSVVAAHPLTTPLAVGTWVRVTVSASPWDPGKQTATAQIGAAPGETFSLVQSLPIGLGAFIVLGVRATGPAGAAEVSYDNVTYDDVP